VAEHVKHLQLGVDLTVVDLGLDDDPEHLGDDADLDEVWATATTVEQFKIDIELLAGGSDDGA
jgi:hypothetical protein